MTKLEMREFISTEFWKHLSDEEIVRFQLFRKKMYMPLEVYLKSLQCVVKSNITLNDLIVRDKLIKQTVINNYGNGYGIREIKSFVNERKGKE